MVIANEKKRKKLWFPNAFLFWILKPLKFTRNMRLWVFGAWEGKKYSDNSKYLFEYVEKNNPDIECVWITKSDQVYAQLKDNGIPVYMSDSFQGRIKQLKCGVVFYTNGLDDISDYCFVSGAKIVALWHGIGMKKTYYSRVGTSGLKGKLRTVKDHIFSWVYRDLSIASADLSKNFIEQKFRVGADSIKITGQPRNDAFKVNPYFLNNHLQDLGLDKFNYKVLYMPTHRPYEDQTIQETILYLDNNIGFQHFLETENVAFIIKLHNLSKIDFEIKSKNMFVISNDDPLLDAQNLMLLSDALITDYSSCIVDYVIQNKPVVLFAPDYKKYCDNVGIMAPWPKIYRERAIVEDDKLVKEISEIKGMKGRNDLASYLHSICEDQSIENTCYSENVMKLCIDKYVGGNIN